MIEISNLKLNYNNHKALDIDKLIIDTSITTALLGFNGSGKSTLIKVIAHLIKPNSGEIKIWGKSKLNLKDLKEIAVLLPEPMLLKRSVRQNFMFALKSRQNETKFNQIVPECLELVGLDETFLDKRHFELSSGQLKRVAFAITLSLRSKLVLLDEPTNAIDLATAKLFAKSINYIKEQYKTGFIIASHDEKWLSALSQNSIFLHDGKVCEFELKNIFSAKNGYLQNFDIKLPNSMKNSTKIAINPNKISLNKPDSNISGILHSVSLVYDNSLLIKIKIGENLIKCIIKDANIGKYITGEKVNISIDESAFLSLE